MAAALLLGACGEDDETTSAGSTDTTSTTTAAADEANSEILVEVEPSPAAPGSTVMAAVRNDSEMQFTYGAAYELDRLTGDAWEMVELPPTAVIEIAYVAPPGRDGAALEVELPEDLEPGTYRVVVARDAAGFGLVAGELEVADG